MPNVASETSALIHRHPQAPRNPSANGREDESPFAMLLDMGIEPPASTKALAATQKETRKPEAASNQRPASKPESRHPGSEKTAAKDAPESGATKSGDIKSGDAESGAATGADQELQETAAFAVAAEEEQLVDATEASMPADLPVAEIGPVSQPQPVITAQPAAAALPVAADHPAIVPDAEADLLAQAPAQPQQIIPTDPQDKPAGDAPGAAADSLQTAAAPDTGEETDAKMPNAKDATADAAGKSAPNAVEQAEGQPQDLSHQGQDGEAEKGDGKNAKDAAHEARPRARPDVKPEPAPQPQDPAPAARAAADAMQPLSITPQNHASVTGQAHASWTSPVAHAVPVTGLAVEIAQQALAGKHRFEIRLDPPELGRIDVRLDVDREGNVTSRLVVERAETYDLLRRDASTLERALQNAGLKTSDHALEFSLRDQGFAHREEPDDAARNAAQVIVSDGDQLGGDNANPYGRLLGLGGGIDIRV